jgi:hypothetical protein
MVEARVATEREEITTTLVDGTVETVNTAEESDVVVTNPGGEKYVLKPEKFAGKLFFGSFCKCTELSTFSG